MASLFFYGTLRHLPLLEIVLGRAADDIDMVVANLPGHAVYWVENAPFPMIEVAPDQSAPGLLLRDLSQQDIARLNFYEGGFSYDLKPVQVEVGSMRQPCQVYVSAPGLWPRGNLWSLHDWQDQWADLNDEAAREVMGYFGQRSPEELARMLPTIRARAAARINAKQASAANPSGMGRQNVVHRGWTRPYVDFFAMDEYQLQFERFDGSLSPVAKRAVFVATDAVIVLPYDVRRDRVMLVEQFRAGPYARGDRQPWQLEPIAGRLDFGETPEDTARREAAEEAGLALSELHAVAQCYASPGCSTEYYYVFVALADLPDDVTGVAGLDSEDEDIRSHILSFDGLMQMVDDMQAANAPLVLAALWLARHRDQLRAAT